MLVSLFLIFSWRLFYKRSIVPKHHLSFKFFLSELVGDQHDFPIGVRDKPGDLLGFVVLNLVALRYSSIVSLVKDS